MAKIEIGLSMLYKLGESFDESVVDAIKTGAKFIEVVDDGSHILNKNRVSKLIELSNSYSLKYSVHAPFADINIASPSRSLLGAMLKRLKKSLANANALDAYMWIFHPGLRTGISMFYPEEDWAQNRKSTRLLYKTAVDYGVKVAIENVPEPYPFLMKNVENFRKFYEEVEEDVGLALDVGHANLNGQIELFLEYFSDRITHIHAHDNDGREDQHLGIGFGTVNWEKIAKLLKKIPYNGTAVVESITHIHESLHRLKMLLV